MKTRVPLQRSLFLIIPAFFCLILTHGICIAELAAEPPEPFSIGFKGLDVLPEGWTVQGTASVVEGDAFDDSRSLRLNRIADESHLPNSVTSAAFRAVPGKWEIGVAGKSALHSPDNSFNGKVWLECLDEKGATLERFPIADFFGKTDWAEAGKVVEFPPGTSAARFFIVLNKTHGDFWVDAFSAKYLSAGRAATQTVDRILFASAQMGNLLYPEDSRKFTITVETFKPLPENNRALDVEVRDYWGAAQAEKQRVTLKVAGKNQTRFVYEGSVDLTDVPVEIGRYYELHASLSVEGEPAFSNHTSFAILPEAITKKYRPEEIPFTSRNWDNRIPEFMTLTDRLGIRICGVWGRWTGEPPYEARAPQLDLVAKLGMGGLSTTPIALIEKQKPGWEKYDAAALRGGVRNLLELTKPVRPFIINLGNEPDGKEEVVRRFVDAYKEVYQEVKKIEPGIFVVGSSAGPKEEFFKAGFGEWCDAYDFHTYADSKAVRNLIAEYKRLFAKYGHAKPIWSTELGLNSQGLERRAVAVELIKKLTVFFAAGGANACWFGLVYPDRDLKLHGGSEDSHNVFDSRYARYAPRLDAVAHYNMVNAIAIKKFVEETTYSDGTYAAFFRDRDGLCLQILWREEGPKDVFLPLVGVEKTDLIRIDGRRRTFDAAGKGLSVTVGPDPLILIYPGPDTGLAKKLETPAATITSVPEEIVRGTTVEIGAENGGAKTLEITAPPLWKSQTETKGNTVRFTLSVPAAGNAREADLLFPLRDAEGRETGELSRRIAVAGQLSVRILPEPLSKNGMAGVRIVLANRGSSPQQVSWEAALLNSLALKDGQFGPPDEPRVRYGLPAKGTVAIEPGRSESVVLPLEDVDVHQLYRVQVVATASDGSPVAAERLVGGFAGVPKAVQPPALDGRLDEAAWKNSPVQILDQKYQFAPLRSKPDSWTGPGDLSAKVRFLWDDRYLYIGVETTDDLTGTQKRNKEIWSQDSLQFLLDPARESSVKPGKYDYAVALGAKGPQAWCYLTADATRAPVGEVEGIKVSAIRGDGTTGSMTYEVAVPWARISPFQPKAGANLGLTLILNEDDGPGRESFMTWFGNAHTKQVDTAGDLILLGEKDGRDAQ